MSAGHGHIDPSNKKIALMIAVLALVLALSETLGKSHQVAGLAAHIEASNLWSFFQAKTIRQTVLRTAAEQSSLTTPNGSPVRNSTTGGVKSTTENSGSGNSTTPNSR